MKRYLALTLIAFGLSIPARADVNAFDATRLYLSAAAEGAIDGIGMHLAMKIVAELMSKRKGTSEVLGTMVTYGIPYLISRWVAHNAINVANAGYDYKTLRAKRKSDPAYNLSWFLGVLGGWKATPEFNKLVNRIVINR